MNIPAPIKLTPEEVQAFKSLSEQRMAMQQFISMISDEGERRASNVRAEGKAFWAKVAEKYQIDIDNVMWDMTEDGHIRPVSVRLSGE